ncbi:larval cuticle protein A2B-like [Diorhabda carinulata]|uniref:larval cuticle protein A2B-like n=1 Tax=Diorhabda sublineata TaxID=1163346 RepID=UPI0024E0BA3C|nr:larval cuticle protein A2B-like [Diorhabda sublineata]XP_057666758.1 larval cuticle protein A2B-like [Diorhabda carinulata]
MFTKFAVLFLYVSTVHGIPISYISNGLHLDDDYGHFPVATHAVAAPVAIAKPVLTYAKPVVTYAKPIAIAKQEVVDYSAPAHYEFKYGVDDPHTGDKKQQSESRVGDTVKGEYSLAESDGTVRVVKYTADPHNGFNAVVSRIGKAAHPQVVHKIVQPVVAKTLISPVVDHGYGLDLYGH